MALMTLSSEDVGGGRPGMLSSSSKRILDLVYEVKPSVKNIVEAKRTYQWRRRRKRKKRIRRESLEFRTQAIAFNYPGKARAGILSLEPESPHSCSSGASVGPSFTPPPPARDPFQDAEWARCALRIRAAGAETVEEPGSPPQSPRCGGRREEDEQGCLRKGMKGLSGTRPPPPIAGVEEENIPKPGSAGAGQLFCLYPTAPQGEAEH
eukprot:Hpha_TRINITY_DN15497_c2_g6::TRINITY_DN15497_c2_g6_i1::g.176284::m.176284